MARHAKASAAEQALLDTYEHIEKLLRRDLGISKAFCSTATAAKEQQAIRESYEALLAGIAKALAVIRGEA